MQKCEEYLWRSSHKHNIIWNSHWMVSLLICTHILVSNSDAQFSDSVNCKIYGRGQQGVPHQMVLPHCAAVVHHAGAGTTARCLFHGVPMLLIPLLRWFDQPAIAEAVQQLGVGITLDLTSCLVRVFSFSKYIDYLLMCQVRIDVHVHLVFTHNFLLFATNYALYLHHFIVPRLVWRVTAW